MHRLFYLFLGLSWNLYACEMRVRIYPFEPLARFEHGQWSGMDADYTTALLGEIGCKPAYVNAPWARGLKLLRQGDVDMMINMSRTREREDFAYFIGPQRIESHVLALAPDKSVEDWESLLRSPYLLGIQRGIVLGPEFERLRRHSGRFSGQLIYVANNDNKLDLLKKGRIQGVIEHKVYFRYQQKLGTAYSALKIQPLDLLSEPVYFALSRKSVSQARFNQLSAAFKKLKSEGRFKRIEEKYQ